MRINRKNADLGENTHLKEHVGQETPFCRPVPSKLGGVPQPPLYTLLPIWVFYGSNLDLHKLSVCQLIL